MTAQRLITIVAVLAAFPVNADELVDRADANGDGYVSLYELRAAYYADMEFNRRIEQSFADYDTDGDGLISEAERRVQADATAETVPGAGMATPASGETAAIPATGMAPATAAEVASTPEAVTVVTPAVEVPPTPATGLSAAPAAEMAPTPAAGLSTTAEAETASTPNAETLSAGTPGIETGVGGSGGRSPEVASVTTTADGALPGTGGLSRTELWIQQIDADNSGGASISELAASGDGVQWFPESDFASADKNGDGDLDPDELEVLIQSMERRQRR